MLSVVIGIIAFLVAVAFYAGSLHFNNRLEEDRMDYFQEFDSEVLKEAASKKSSRYSLYRTLCRAGAWMAGAVAFVAVIYPFLQL